MIPYNHHKYVPLQKAEVVFMDMKIVKTEKKICSCCMEEHEVKTVLVKEKTTYKKKSIEYNATYIFCDKADELYMEEEQIQENDISLKDAYRISEKLLTSKQIYDIRKKYGISQKDLCILLGWGGKTITRYESHQIQDRAHDMILKKIDQDPEWFIELLEESKEKIQPSSYENYKKKAVSFALSSSKERILKIKAFVASVSV